MVAAGASYSAEALNRDNRKTHSCIDDCSSVCLVLSLVEARRMKQEGQSVQCGRKSHYLMFIWFMVASIITSVGLFPSSLVPYAKLTLAVDGDGISRYRNASVVPTIQAGAKTNLNRLATWFMVAVSN